MGLRQEKRDRTEDTIVSVAFRLFEEQGYRETTVEEIAAQSDISPRTFYRYFDSKDAVLAVNGFRYVGTALQQVGPDPSFDELARALAAATEGSLGHDYTKVVRRILREDPEMRERPAIWRHQWAQHMAEGLSAKQGRDQPDKSDRVLAGLVIELAGSAAEQHLYEGGERPLSGYVEEVLHHLHTSLRQ